MNEKLQHYSNTHKKCLHCIYLHHISKPLIGIDYFECKVKNKIINDYFPNNINRRRWCKMFELDESKE